MRTQHAIDAGARELRFEPAHLLDYVKVLYKHRWPSATAFVVVVLSVGIHSFTTTPIYEARSKILIEAEAPNVVSFEEVIEESQARSDYYQTQYNILQSRSLARRTLDGLQLWEHPTIRESAEEPSSPRGMLATSVAWLRWVTGSGDREQVRTDESAAESAAIDRLLAGITVAPVRNSRIVDLKYRSPDSPLAARVVNTHAKGYIEQHLEFKFLSSKEASDWLAARLAEQRAQVEAAEVALQRYREHNDAVAADDSQNIVVQKLADLNAAVTRAKTDRIEKEALFNQLQAIQNEPTGLGGFPAILTNVVIQQLNVELAAQQRRHAELAQMLGDRHPDLIQARSAIQAAQTRLDDEVAKVVQAVQNQYFAAVAQERGLTAALEAQKREALSMNREAIEFDVLRREVESTRQVYNSLLQRAKETGVSRELRASNVRIVDPAETPQAPVVPRTRRNLVFAVFGGLLLAIGLAFFFEYVNDRVKTPEDIKMRLGLPFLGLIPQIEGDELSAGRLVNNGVPAGFREAFRVVQTNVLFSSAEPGGRSLLVTSAAAHEGKTMVSGNLALGLALLGSRVVLVDADMRRPSMHAHFGLDREPGLSNVLVGNADAREAVRSTEVPGLWLLPSGRVPPNPVELLAAPRFREVLRQLTQEYDWVVLDSPPVMAVADATVLGRATSGVLFVVGAEMVSRTTVEAAIERLEGAEVHFMGAVLNRVDLKRHAYYYESHYRAEYGEYYSLEAAAGSGNGRG